MDVPENALVISFKPSEKVILLNSELSTNAVPRTSKRLGRVTSFKLLFEKA